MQKNKKKAVDRGFRGSWEVNDYREEYKKKGDFKATFLIHSNTATIFKETFLDLFLSAFFCLTSHYYKFLNNALIKPRLKFKQIFFNNTKARDAEFPQVVSSNPRSNLHQVIVFSFLHLPLEFFFPLFALQAFFMILIQDVRLFLLVSYFHPSSRPH